MSMNNSRLLSPQVNVRSDELHMIKDENYPIHLAVLHDVKFLELLISHGADTNVKTCTQQMTLLHIGCSLLNLNLR